jgi:hypothetical protein
VIPLSSFADQFSTFFPGEFSIDHIDLGYGGWLGGTIERCTEFVVLVSLSLARRVYSWVWRNGQGPFRSSRRAMPARLLRRFLV